MLNSLSAPGLFQIDVETAKERFYRDFKSLQ